MNNINASDNQLQYWQKRAIHAEKQLKAEQDKRQSLLQWVLRNFRAEFENFSRISTKN